VVATIFFLDVHEHAGSTGGENFRCLGVYMFNLAGYFAKLWDFPGAFVFAANEVITLVPDFEEFSP
jgi:hypothetical protein